MFKSVRPILYGGREVLPLIEGGKGVSATNHASSGAWAAAGGIGTVSAVNADSYDAEGRIIPQLYHALTRRDRHEELIRYAIDGAVEQVRRAYDIASGRGAININVLWEMGGAQRVLRVVAGRPGSQAREPGLPACGPRPSGPSGLHSHPESAKQDAGTLGVRVTTQWRDRGDEADPTAGRDCPVGRPSVAGVGSIHPPATKSWEDWSLWQPR